jgi:hypothetical protein
VHLNRGDEQKDTLVQKVEPVVGSWYKRPGRSIFEVVAIDEDGGTVELQFFDGTVDELDMDAWESTFIEQVEPPEDYSGSMDVVGDDYEAKEDEHLAKVWDDPIAFLEQAD